MRQAQLQRKRITKILCCPFAYRTVLLFKPKQELLDADAAAVAGELPGSADNTMAWHDDGNRVPAVGLPDRACFTNVAGTFDAFGLAYSNGWCEVVTASWGPTGILHLAAGQTNRPSAADDRGWTMQNRTFTKAGLFKFRWTFTTQ